MFIEIESYESELGFELAIPESAVRRTIDCDMEAERSCVCSETF